MLTCYLAWEIQLKCLPRMTKNLSLLPHQKIVWLGKYVKKYHLLPKGTYVILYIIDTMLSYSSSSSHTYICNACSHPSFKFGSSPKVQYRADKKCKLYTNKTAWLDALIDRDLDCRAVVFWKVGTSFLLTGGDKRPANNQQRI